MAFPYIAPFDPWVEEVLNIRAENQILGSLKNPFIIMTSGARVIKSPETIELNKEGRINKLKELLSPTAQKPTKDLYEGCIISNNVNNINLSYSHTAGTPVGIDLNGKIITVENERNRNVSSPIILSLDVDGDGANNTLKNATVQVKCFSLKQLEMFELFFMRPGMNVLLEFGDGGLVGQLNRYRKPNSSKKYKVYRNGQLADIDNIDKIQDCLIPKNKGADEFVKEFVQYFRSGLENSIAYFNKIESSLGTYDMVAGKVISYSFSYQQDGTYDCEIKISQSNQISLAIPNNPPKRNSARPAASQNNSGQHPVIEQIIDSLVLNFNLNKDNIIELLGREKIDIEKEIFNFVKEDTTNKDQTASSDAYISVRFILKILMNYILSGSGGTIQQDFFKLNIPKAIFDGKEIEVIPVKSNKNLISSSPLILFPSEKLPKFTLLNKGDSNTKAEDRIVIDGKSYVDGRINGYDFHFPNGTTLDTFFQNSKDNKIKISAENDKEILGNALNIFIKYDEVVRTWNQEIFRIDFLSSLLDLINKQSYGLFQLIYSASDDSSAALPTIIDLKFQTSDTVIQSLNRPAYRFKIGPKNSIVTNFSFNFEMTNLMASQAIYGNLGTLYQAAADAKKKKPTEQSTNNQQSGTTEEKQKSVELEITPEDKLYSSFDQSSMLNADGWWSINYIEYKSSLQKLKDAATVWDQLSEGTQNAGVTTRTEDQPQQEPDKVSSTEEEVLNFIKGNQVLFQSKGTGSEQIPLIYKDYVFVFEKINAAKETKNNVTISPLNITFTVDGFSGFRCGYYFEIDGVPEIYNKSGRFQIRNVKHSLQNEGWTTTVEAGYLPKPANVIKANV